MAMGICYDRFYGNKGCKAGCILKSLNAQKFGWRAGWRQTVQSHKKLYLGAEWWAPFPSVPACCLTYRSAPPPSSFLEILWLRGWAISLFFNWVVFSGQDLKQLVFLQWKRFIFTALGEQAGSLSWIRVEDRSASVPACFQMGSPGVDICPLGWLGWTWSHTGCWDWWGAWMVRSAEASRAEPLPGWVAES